MRRLILAALLLPAPALASETLLRGLTMHLPAAEIVLHNAEILIDSTGSVRCLSGEAPRLPVFAQAKPCHEGATEPIIIDFAGKGVAIPNLIEPLTHLGLLEVDAEDESTDGATGKLANTAQIRAIDGVRSNSRAIVAAQQAGVGIAVVYPLGNGLVTGQSAALRTCGGGIDQAIIRSPIAVHARIGHEVKHDDLLTGSRSGQLAQLRSLLGQAQRLAKAQKSKVKGTPAEEQSLQQLRDDASLQPLVEVMAGRLPLLVYADNADDIAAVLRLQRELGFRLQIAGGAEAYLVATELAAQHVPVILTPVVARPNDFAHLRAVDDAALRLQQAGVELLIASDDTHNVRNLRWNLGLVVHQGVPWAAALRMATVDAARVLGLEPSVVAIAPGLPANFTVFDGDPLTYDGHVVWTSCGGTLWPQPQQR